jgi:hypothetical protein
MRQTDDRRGGAETVSARSARIGGFTHGFDYLRIILAVAVVLQHSVLSSYGGDVMDAIWGSWRRVYLAPILPMFFALSGFRSPGSQEEPPTPRHGRCGGPSGFPALASSDAVRTVQGPLSPPLPLSEYSPTASHRLLPQHHRRIHDSFRRSMACPLLMSQHQPVDSRRASAT